MPKYSVVMPATARIQFWDIEANSSEEAIEKVWEVDFSLDVVCKDSEVIILEMEMHSKVVEGNCYHGVANVPEVILEEE